MSRRLFLNDDKTDCNGPVLDGVADSSFDGRPLANLVAPVSCNTCSAEGPIIGDRNDLTCCSRYVATGSGRITSIDWPHSVARLMYT